MGVRLSGRGLGAVAGILLFGVTACGFEPMYAEKRSGSVSQAELSTVQIDLIADREGQMLRNGLLDRFQPRGSAAKPLYILTVGLQIQRVGLGILTDETASRANLIMTANYTVRELDKGAVLFNGRSRAITGYNVLDSEFATVSSENDAIRRAVDDLTNQITTRVSIVLSQPRTAQAQPQAQ